MFAHLRKCWLQAAVLLTLVVLEVPNLVFAQGSGEIRAGAIGGLKLDYGFFKSYVEPVFLKRRVNHARCYVCHEEGRNRLRLEKLLPGKDYWTEEQSRKNFETVSHMVVPGDPLQSRLLLHALAPEAGGDPTPRGMHPGGRQFATQEDPDFKRWAEWVSGAKASNPSDQK